LKTGLIKSGSFLINGMRGTFIIERGNGWAQNVTFRKTSVIYPVGRKECTKFRKYFPTLLTIFNEWIR
jgi:hypothetical protein